MAETDCWYAWEAEQSSHGLQVMMAMNYVGRHRQGIEVIDNGYRRSSNVPRDVSQLRAVSNRSVSALEQSERQIAYVKF